MHRPELQPQWAGYRTRLMKTISFVQLPFMKHEGEVLTFDAFDTFCSQLLRPPTLGIACQRTDGVRRRRTIVGRGEQRVDDSDALFASGTNDEDDFLILDHSCVCVRYLEPCRLLVLFAQC